MIYQTKGKEKWSVCSIKLPSLVQSNFTHVVEVLWENVIMQEGKKEVLMTGVEGDRCF